VPRLDALLADTVAAASAEYGMHEWANWLPAEQHEALREAFYDLVYTALVAYADLVPMRLAVPSTN
jgi:hypothetical protein